MGLLSGDKYATVNLVTAELHNLVDVTSEYLSRDGHLYHDFATTLNRELKTRFTGYVFFHAHTVMKDNIYLTTALLDPFTAPALDDTLFGNRRWSAVGTVPMVS